MSSWVSNFTAGRSPYVENPWGKREARRKMTPLSMAALAIVDVLARKAAESGPAQDGIDEKEPTNGKPDHLISSLP